MNQQPTNNNTPTIAQQLPKRVTKKKRKDVQFANLFDKIEYTPNNSMFSVSKKKKVNVQEYETVLFFTNSVEVTTKSSKKSTKKKLAANYFTSQQSSQSNIMITNSQPSPAIQYDTKSQESTKDKLPPIRELLAFDFNCPPQKPVHLNNL